MNNVSLSRTRCRSFRSMLARLAAFLDLYATQPLLPLLARDVSGVARFAVSLTITAPTVAVALAAPFIGRLADRLGLRARDRRSRRWTLAVATALAATSTSLPAADLLALRAGRRHAGHLRQHRSPTSTKCGRRRTPAGRPRAYMTGTILGGFTGRAVAGLVAADASWRGGVRRARGARLAVVAAALAMWLPAEPRQARGRAAPRQRRASTRRICSATGSSIATCARRLLRALHAGRDVHLRDASTSRRRRTA